MHRFIPAWAGNRAANESAPFLPTVHPRMGGEQPERYRERASVDGSSPHGRGTGVGVGHASESPRFIPAWAGNRVFVLPEPVERTVHPRMGGEQQGGGSDKLYLHGSSPHGRGTAYRVLFWTGTPRFIPAWAGNRAISHGAICRISVHPRMGGEQKVGHLPDVSSGGSSPHGRGTGVRVSV